MTAKGQADSLEKLRFQHYNAQVVQVAYLHPELMILRVRPDRGIPTFIPGQYVVLGLGQWEPRAANTPPELDHCREPDALIKRAYSISCSLLDGNGNLLRATESPYYELYIALVRDARHGVAALTPRLFLLREGDGIFCGPRPHGQYNLDMVRSSDDVVFAATGTGEAPHNAMLAHLLARGHRGRIVCVTCVRKKEDLGYRSQHAELQRRFPNYRYLSLTTREPENLDSHLPAYQGRRHLQEYFISGDFERDAGLTLPPDRTHVFLCGNPQMIGVPQRSHDVSQHYPKPLGMVEVLERRGFSVDQPHDPGNIHFEKYW